MNNEVNYEGVTSANWKSIQGKEVAPNIFERVLWEGIAGRKAVVFEFKAGAKFPGVDFHQSGAEQIYVISGVFNDGKNDYSQGSFIHNPIGSAHIPQSKKGCVVLIIFPEG